jgi:hypothetical protein
MDRRSLKLLQTNVQFTAMETTVGLVQEQGMLPRTQLLSHDEASHPPCPTVLWLGPPTIIRTQQVHAGRASRHDGPSHATTTPSHPFPSTPPPPHTKRCREKQESDGESNERQGTYNSSTGGEARLYNKLLHTLETTKAGAKLSPLQAIGDQALKVETAR